MTTKAFAVLMLTMSILAASASLAQCPSSVPAEGASLPPPLPLFPPDNWWNIGGASPTATITIAAPAPAGGVSVALTTSNRTAIAVPAKVVVPAGSTSASFAVSTRSVFRQTSVTVTASYAGIKKSAVITLTRR